MTTGDFDLPLGNRGEWTSPDTFVLEYDNIANNDHVFLTIRFEEERVFFNVHETAHEGSANLKGGWKNRDSEIQRDHPHQAAPAVHSPAAGNPHPAAGKGLGWFGRSADPDHCAGWLRQDHAGSSRASSPAGCAPPGSSWIRTTTRSRAFCAI